MRTHTGFPIELLRVLTARDSACAILHMRESGQRVATNSAFDIVVVVANR